MLNHKRIIYLLFISIIIMIIFIGGDIAYFLLYFLVALLLLPYLYNRKVLKELSGEVLTPNVELYIGDDINISYSIRNNTHLPIAYLEIENIIGNRLLGKETDKNIISLDVQSVYIKTLNIVGTKRGVYETGEIKVLIKDVFGLVTLEKYIKSEAKILVFPEIININSFSVKTSQQLGDLKVSNKAFKDRSRVDSLREYTPGDSFKRIHWKASAKGEEILVKNFEERGDNSIEIFIDSDIDNYFLDRFNRIEDKLVDISLAIINYCLKARIDIRLCFNEKDEFINFYGRERGDIKSFLRVFANFRPRGKNKFYYVIEKLKASIVKGSTAILITNKLDKKLGMALLDLKSSNIKPCLIIITDEENNINLIDKDIKKKLEYSNLNIYTIDIKDDIKLLLEDNYEKSY